MIVKDGEAIEKAIEQVANEMCVAARTSPKTRGDDTIEIIVLKDDSVKKLSEKMMEIAERTGREAYRRNSEPVGRCSHVVVIGSRIKRHALKPCSFCGFKDCDENEKKGAVCAFNSIDLGIAASSAVSVAVDHRVDNRIMWTIGIAALEMGSFGSEVKMAVGIPLSVTGKNIFFDRK